MTKLIYRQSVHPVTIAKARKKKMRVNKIVKSDENVYSFDGELSDDEHALVITLGLNFLYAQGLLETMAPNVDVNVLEGTESVN